MAANSQRYRSGPQAVVTGKIKAGVEAGVGDLVELGSDDYVYPAASIAVNGSGSGSGGGFTGGDAQSDFKSTFLGVLIEGATSGDEEEDSDCVVATDGTYEYPLDEAADADYPPGTPLETVVSGGTLLSQQLQLASTRTDAIALLARQLPEGAETAEVRIFSSIMGNELS